MISFDQVLKDLANNPSHQFYLFIENVLEESTPFKPQYLELNGCLKCFGTSHIDFKFDKLRDLCQDCQPQTHENKIGYKFTKLREICQVEIKFNQKNRFHMPDHQQIIKSLNFYTNSNISADLSLIRQDIKLWKKVKSISLDSKRRDLIVVKLPQVQSAKFFMIELIANGKVPSFLSTCPNCSTSHYDPTNLFFCSSCQLSPVFDCEIYVRSRISCSSDAIEITDNSSKNIVCPLFPLPACLRTCVYTRTHVHTCTTSLTTPRR